MDWTDRIGRRLTPRDLHVFMAVAEDGSMAKASSRLAISRPVISKTITDLEAVLGVRLLDRTPAGVHPTVYGEALLRLGRAVFDELRQGIEDLAALADPGAGLLRIGTTEVTAGGIVAVTVSRLFSRYPRLRFHMERGDAHLRLDLLRERRVDLFVTRPQTTEPEPDVIHEPLAFERLLVVCGAANPWARRRRVTLAELARQPWILAPAEILPDGPITKAFRAAGLALPDTIIVSDSLNFRYNLLADGRFITVIPHLCLRLGPQIPWLREVAVPPPIWRLPTTIARLTYRTLIPTAQLFIAEARAVAAEFGEPLA